MFVLSVLTLIAGGFICVAGMYVIITLIVRAYESGSEYSGSRQCPKLTCHKAVPKPFQC